MKLYYYMENEELLDALQQFIEMLDVAVSPEQFEHTKEQVALIRKEILNRMNFRPAH